MGAWVSMQSSRLGAALVSVFFSIGFTGVSAAADDEVSCAFIATPERVVSASVASVRVAYSVARAGAVRLHCEVKGQGGYHVSDQALVSGEGTHVFEMRMPSIRQSREARLIIWMGTDWRRPLNGALIEAPIADVVTPARARRLDRQKAEAAGLQQAWEEKAPAVGVYVGRDSVWAEEFAAEFSGELTELGLSSERLTEAQLDNPYWLTPDLVSLVVLIDAGSVPLGGVHALEAYVRHGGRLAVAGGEVFGDLLYPLEDQWLSTAAYRAAVVRRLRTTVLLDFDAGAVVDWRRASNNPGSGSTAEVVSPGADDSAACLRLTIRDLTGWDTFQHSLEPGSIDDSGVWLTFRARGDPHTSQLAVELSEQDGSRWIAVVPLSVEWQSHALPLEAFTYWHDSTSQGRGSPGDRVNLARVTSLSAGLAFTHTKSVGGGDHRIWIDRIGWAPASGEDVYAGAFSGEQKSAPRIATLSPEYKTFEVSSARAVRSNAVQHVAPGLSRRVSAGRSPVARPQGTGFGKSRRWRFIPILEYVDAQDRFCGTAASLCLYSREEGGGMVGFMGVTDPGFFDREVANWLSILSWRMVHGLFFYEAGAAYYASFGGEDMPMGFRLTNRGDTARGVAARLTVADATGTTLWAHTFVKQVQAGADATVDATWPLPRDGQAPYVVTAELLSDEEVADHLRHSVQVWRPRRDPLFMGRGGGAFKLDGQPWYAHGVNYMPSSGIGMEDTNYFEYWLDPQPYDPDVIERDLEDIARIGFNMVSVFQYYRSMTSRNLLDFLIRCRRHGLKVNLSLRPGTPMDFRWDEVRAMIESARLARNDTLMAYDLAWEPHWRGHQQRQTYDRLWEHWVVDTYGSTAQAEEAWGHEIPRREGTVTNPSDEQVSREGPWLHMVNAYYRFLNELLHERYGRARELVRSVDPNHLVSFRMSMAGDPTRDNRSLTYDFRGLRDAVDILEPEGYGRIGDWEKVKPGWFTVAYGRCVAPALPILWAEFGVSVWSRPEGMTLPSRLKFAAEYYEDFYTMAYRSGSSGTVCWWFPGGFRWNERSDYGILNPDRSWRPVTRVIHEWRDRMTEPREVPEADVLIPFDRGATSRQVPGIYDQVKDAFWEAVDSGRQPGLREVESEF